MKSIKMVLDKMVDGAAIDSNTLSYQMKCDPELRKKLHIVTSWGPLPVYPAVVSSKLPGKFIFFCSIFKIPPDWMFKQGTINHDCSKKLGR